ncbi:MAG: hypothetical protein LBB11_01665 [Puniceicoccales bacterium]|jgi:hypothetical protein|nr:hypothetical protein [Puniceicoccales bacterium]
MHTLSKLLFLCTLGILTLEIPSSVGSSQNQSYLATFEEKKYRGIRFMLSQEGIQQSAFCEILKKVEAIFDVDLQDAYSHDINLFTNHGNFHRIIVQHRDAFSFIDYLIVDPMNERNDNIHNKACREVFKAYSNEQKFFSIMLHDDAFTFLWNAIVSEKDHKGKKNAYTKTSYANQSDAQLQKDKYKLILKITTIASPFIVHILSRYLAYKELMGSLLLRVEHFIKNVLPISNSNVCGLFQNLYQLGKFFIKK